MEASYRVPGAGVIIASVTIGSGEVVWASRSGAMFGYGMRWCFLYECVFKAIQVYTAARHMTLIGEHPMVG
jgi:Mn2+/Fe2+ NRAMP family transporter